MSPSGKRHSVAIQAYVDVTCDEFEEQLRNGTQPRIEEILRGAPQEARNDLFRALLDVNLELAPPTDANTALQEYLVRFSEFSNAVKDAFSEQGLVDSAATETAMFEESGRSSQLQRNEGRIDLSNSATDTRSDISIPSLPRKLGRFELTRLLGSGAFGQVYLANDPKLGREVAIKIPSNLASGNENDLRRFLREARAAADLRHKNICPVFEIGEVDGIHFIVMGYIKGRTLGKHLGSKRLQADQVARLAKRLAGALQYAHDKGVVHRDLKPANVIFDEENNEPVIMDFGLAHTALSDGEASLTQEGTLMGTPTHMSPEQARGASGEVTPAFDIYSLGVIMYEALCQHLPFSGSVTEVLGKVLHVSPETPSTRSEDVDPRLEAICLKMMAKRPEDRYATMDQVVTALTEFATQPVLKSTAPAPGTTEVDYGQSHLPWWRRRFIQLGAVISLAAVVAIFAAVIVFRTKYGTLRIEVLNPDITVMVDNETIEFQDGRFQGKKKLGKHRFAVMIGETRVPLDEPGIQIAGQQRELVVELDGKRISANEFDIVRNKETVLRVSLTPAPPIKEVIRTKGFEPIMPTAVTSVSGTKFLVSQDGSVFADGRSRDDSFTFRATTKIPNITAIRLDALPHPNIPSQGPGRGRNGRFEITGLSVQSASLDGKVSKVHTKISGLRSDDAPTALDRLLDRNPSSFWPVARPGETTTLLIYMARPLGNESGAVLTLELQQRFTLGHFRVSVSNDPSLSGTLSQVSPRLPLFVNLGGEAEMRDGIIWEASVPFEGVGYGYIGGRALKSSAGAPPLSSCISGIEAFRVQLPNGKYAVSLIFCGRWPDDVKSRSFSVSIEGRKPQTISNIPAVARGAQSVAFFNVQAEVSDGVLDVNFEEGMGETVLNGITINQAR